MKISVITPTVRPNGLPILARSLQEQSCMADEWIIVTPELETSKQMLKDYDLPIIWIKDPEKEEGDVYTLNKALNAAVRASSGDVIVSVQDFIWLPPEALHRLTGLSVLLGEDYMITGVGDQYQSVDKWGMPTGRVWSDPRKQYPFKTGDCEPFDIEENFCLYTRKGLEEVGGWDEGLDKGFAMNNTSVVERMSECGYKFYLDTTLEIRAVSHGRLPDWDERHAMNGVYEKRRQELQEQGQWPRLSFLS